MHLDTTTTEGWAMGRSAAVLGQSRLVGTARGIGPSHWDFLELCLHSTRCGWAPTPPQPRSTMVAVSRCAARPRRWVSLLLLRERGCKRNCMTRVVSLRMPPRKVAEVDRRAASSGLDRTRYILKLVEQDLSRPAPKGRRHFASSHLLGKFRSAGSSNVQVRAALGVAARQRHDKNR